MAKKYSIVLYVQINKKKLIVVFSLWFDNQNNRHLRAVLLAWTWRLQPSPLGDPEEGGDAGGMTDMLDI